MYNKTICDDRHFMGIGRDKELIPNVEGVEVMRLSLSRSKSTASFLYVLAG